ncbi:MAG: D-glycero-beta-D-manno-heptose-7-phosphate kinase [Rickettsiales bacterium]
MSTDPKSLIASVDRFSEAHVLCIGDVMLDKFIYGSASRISPEAPIPVLAIEKEITMLGGAGNVVRNIISLGGNATFISIVGNDDVGNAIVSLTAKEPRLYPYLLMDQSRISTQKTRYIAGSQQLLRADCESRAELSEKFVEQIVEIVRQEIERHQVVVLSDYGKGVLSESLVRQVIEIANAADVPVVVDPKSNDFSRYADAYLVSPNQKELASAFGVELHAEEDITDAARILMRANNIGNILVTRGANGMMLVSPENKPFHVKARAREIYDVSGAGDTSLATLAVAIGSGSSLEEAVYLSNTAGGIVVGKIGTAAVYRTDLKTELYTQDVFTGMRKIYPQDMAAEQVETWKRGNLKVGFTNGCFDIVHAGHLALINDAKQYCDRLILAINSDDSVRRLKGDSRPVNNEMDRAILLAELGAVDMVVIFREDTPEELLKKLRPDVLMKGADYAKTQIVGREFVEGYGGEVVSIPLKEGYSTTNTIKKIVGG